jgi:hypothetical protein
MHQISMILCAQATPSSGSTVIFIVPAATGLAKRALSPIRAATLMARLTISSIRHWWLKCGDRQCHSQTSSLFSIVSRHYVDLLCMLSTIILSLAVKQILGVHAYRLFPCVYQHLDIYPARAYSDNDRRNMGYSPPGQKGTSRRAEPDYAIAWFQVVPYHQTSIALHMSSRRPTMAGCIRSCSTRSRIE